MEIQELDSTKFENIFPSPYFVYGRSDFSLLNKQKVEKLLFFAFKESKYRLGLTVGLRDTALFTPFSAPFGGFIFLKDNIKINYIDDALSKLCDWAIEEGYNSLHLTLPPLIYDQSFIAKQINALYRAGFIISKIDLNYHFNLNKFDDNYLFSIEYNARKNLKTAFENNLMFKECKFEDERQLAYNIIKDNREARGFPLSMTWEQVNETIKLVKSDFFLVTNDDNINIASAIVFYIAKNMVQVVYWGDIPEYSHLRTMNFLSFKMFEYYKKTDIKIVDIGPSTENSIPNFGLCEFKESLGCDIQPKITFLKKL